MGRIFIYSRSEGDIDKLIEDGYWADEGIGHCIIVQNKVKFLIGLIGILPYFMLCGQRVKRLSSMVWL